MSYFCVGCDPGVSGAIAVLDAQRHVVLAESLPVVKTAKTPRRKSLKDGGVKIVKGKRTELDFEAVSGLFRWIDAFPGDKYFFIEDVTSMPRDSAVAAFTFGGAFWALQQAAADRGWSSERIKPREWQKMFISNAIKDRAEVRKAYLAVARRMFTKVDLSRVKDAERAAALLIAEYARRTRFGTAGDNNGQ